MISEVDRGEPILVSRRPLFYFMMTPISSDSDTGRRDTFYKRRRREHRELGAKNP